MKRKAQIPDFSQKKKPPMPGGTVQPNAPPPASQVRVIKPQATSSKSGRRGQ